MGKILLGMSGGVDSSVAAVLLMEAGYDVTGVFMKFWSDIPIKMPINANEYANVENKCCSLEAYNDARRVASKLNIKLYTQNMKQNFKKHVVDDFLAQYKKGRTPNPCVQCNRYIKFGEFLTRAKKLSFNYIATGHYVNVKKTKKQKNKKTSRNDQHPTSHFQLLTAKDKDKDQSYFLWTLTQSQLKHCLFPVGDYTKSQIRAIAKKTHLPVHKKKDSQGLCFIKDKRHYEFLRRHLKLKKGPIVTQDGIPEKGVKLGAKRRPGRMTGQGTVIGTHQGLPLYTIGQRREILVGGIGPFYVVKCNYKNNTLYVANKFDRKLLYGRELTTRDVNWISGVMPKMPLECKVKIRYGHPAVPAILKKAKKQEIKVEFKKPQRAITPGQSIVFYQGQQMLGGGVIE